jgi:hypothetical protein
MKRAIFTSVCVLLTAAQVWAAAKAFQSGLIVDIQEKTHTRVLYYVVNTPITKDEPYYEISVQVKDVLYLGRYIPRHADDTLLEEWKPGAAVQARVEGRHLYLKRSSGAELELAIVKQSAVKPGQGSPEAAPAPK